MSIVGTAEPNRLLLDRRRSIGVEDAIQRLLDRIVAGSGLYDGR
jgi:hypothetical protein